MTAPILFSAILANPMILACLTLTTLRCHSPEVPGSGCGLSCSIWMKASWRAGRQPWNKYCVMWIITTWTVGELHVSNILDNGWWVVLASEQMLIHFSIYHCRTAPHYVFIELCLQPQPDSQFYHHNTSIGDWGKFLWDIWNVCYGNDNSTSTLTINGLK